MEVIAEHPRVGYTSPVSGFVGNGNTDMLANAHARRHASGGQRPNLVDAALIYFVNALLAREILSLSFVFWV
jgi:hypothetical protein